LEQLVSEHPAASDYRHLLARCYRELGPSWFSHGSKSTPDGIAKAAKILQDLVAEHPDIPDYRHDLSLTYAWLSTGWPIAPGTEDPAAEQQRRETLDKAVAISDELVAEHPNIPDYAVLQVHVRLRLAHNLWESDPVRAEASLRKALDLQGTLARRFPQSPFYRIGLGSIQESLAVFLRDRGQLPEARSLFESCVASFKAVLKQTDPRNWPIRGVLAQNYRNLADLLARLDDEQAGAEAVRQAEELDPQRQRAD
jgi:tetratricopeptide (TPR) repeat protein